MGPGRLGAVRRRRIEDGQSVGNTGRFAERATNHSYNAQSVLATIYHVLGIDPAATIANHNGRPMYLLDDREPIAELV